MFLFVIGTIIGSFLNVVIYRIPEGKSIIYPPNSFCPKCGHKLSPLDLIPVLSWLFLKGRCRYCGEPISIQYPLVELLTGTLYVFVFSVYGISIKIITGLILVSVLIAVSFIDIKYKEIPTEITITGFILVLAAYIFSLIIGIMNIQEFLDYLYGFLFAGAVMFIFVLPGWMGGGDFKLSAFIGFVIGFKLTPVFLSFLFVIGGLSSIAQMIFTKKFVEKYVPFAPYLALGSIIALLLGHRIINMYLQIL
ncbi:prepilin peptidase [Thermoanaerobacter mathranii]|uniref:prepilin peptidase n=1 Tax=Thermoanaerobacter mathranii TaxID=583357 RepID=UPI003D6AD4AE